MKNKVCLFVMAVLFLFPLVFTFCNSFMSAPEVMDRYTDKVTAYNYFDDKLNEIHFVNVSLKPIYTTLEQYKNLLFFSPVYLRMFWNAVMLTVPIVLGQVIISLLAAYSLGQIKSKYKGIIILVYIFIMLMPAQVLLVSNFIIVKFLHIESGYLAIILQGIFNPLGTVLVYQMSKGFSKEYIEAAFLDGATHVSILFKIFIPLMKPAVVFSIVLTFVDSWNSVEEPLVFITSYIRQPLSITLSNIISTDAASVFAISAFYMIPAILIFLSSGEYIKDDLSLDGLKN